MSWKDNSWLILDVETTGLEAAKERVIEVGYCRVEKRIILETQSFLINPDRQELPEIITKITGLTIADLLPHPKFSTRALQIADLMRQAYVVAAYNAPFDKGFFHYEFERAGHVLPEKPWLDPCVWVKQVDKFQKGKKLIEAASSQYPGNWSPSGRR
jgi:DNA polymerase III epsilon subunit-like protein